ncbi:MAG: hypothetical protein SF123_02935 [Chloroflexota bacterium]|nr:hypothetical protein [Chloroflexota bacterium]
MGWHRNSDGDLSVVQAACGGTTTCADVVLYAAAGSLSAPAWSPDGRSIVVVEGPSAGQPNTRLVELTLNDAGRPGVALQLPSVRTAVVAFTHPYRLGSPAWETSGQSLLLEMRDSASAPNYIERLSRRSGTWVVTGLNAVSAARSAPGRIHGSQPVVVQQASSDTPTPTATPTRTPQQEYYEQFIGIIFWAIYNETNGNQQIPLYEALPGTAPTIANSITDHDHRYLMARTILNNVPLDDLSAGAAYMRRWGGSISNTEYDLWSFQDGRISCEFEGRPVALSYAQAASESDEAILRWFNGYMECLRTGQPLENRLVNFDVAYADIRGFILAAIADYVNESPNPVAGAQYVKHTSSCFVWQRDASGRITSCHGDGARINMQTFCAQSPYVAPPTEASAPTPVPIQSRNCQATSVNPSSVVVVEWLASTDAQTSNQQLGLETVIGTRNLINLGLYTDDQPYSCGLPRCYFLLGNPSGRAPNRERQEEINETRAEAWVRHEAAQMNPDYGYRGFAQSYLVHVLWIDRNRSETWITTVFQQ